MPWSTPFEDPIPLHGGGRLVTLQQAADYIVALPELFGVALALVFSPLRF